MPFKSERAEPLDAMINVRLSVSEKAKLQDDAGLAALTISELVRRRYFGRRIVARADSAVLRELRRLGGLLKHVHNESDGIYRTETAEAINALKLYMSRLSRDHKEG